MVSLPSFWAISTCCFLLSSFFLFSSSGENHQVSTVDVHQAKNLLLQHGHRYLDVRTEEEFKKGHVENSLNIPYMFSTPEGRVKNPKFIDQVLSVCTKEDNIVVGCQSGVRSLYATADLLGAEFKHVNNMGGGYLAWIDNGFAIHKPPIVEVEVDKSHVGEVHEKIYCKEAEL